MRTESSQLDSKETTKVRYKAAKSLFEEWAGKQNWLLVSEKRMEGDREEVSIQMRHYITPAGKKIKVLFSGQIVTEVQRL